MHVIARTRTHTHTHTHTFTQTHTERERDYWLQGNLPIQIRRYISLFREQRGQLIIRDCLNDV